MGRPTDLYIGTSNQISENYKTYIDGLPKSCESIEKVTEYLGNKNKREGLSGAEDKVLTYAESKLEPTGGGRISKKRPTARRLRSSKARKARKVRKARATRRR